jgi:hypothetical protein
MPLVERCAPQVHLYFFASGDPRATDRTGPDNYSFARPVLVLDCRGADCDVPIEKIAMTW